MRDRVAGESGGEILYLRPDKILEPKKKNDSRQDDDLDSELEEPTDDPNFSQLVRSIKAIGLLQPIGVRLLPTGEYELVYGNRRRRAFQIAFPGKKIPCLLREAEDLSALNFTSKEEEDDFAALLANLTENMHRRRLKPWELADDFYRLHKLNPGIPKSHLATLCAVSHQYFTDLVLIRSKLHPDLWALYKRRGPLLRVKRSELVQIAHLPRPAQPDAWNDLMTERERVGGSRGRGPQIKPTEKKLLKYLAIVDSLDCSREWRRGAKYVLRVALGQTRWAYGTVPMNERKSPVRDSA